MKIKVLVEGGVVQSVFSDDPDIDVEVMDYDSLKETATKDEIAEKELALARDTPYEVW